MTITLIQHDIKWHNVYANIQTVAKMLDSIENATDLIVLPEMWNTGFITNPENTKIADYKESLAFIQEWAHQLNAAIVGSMPTEENGKYYNRLYFVKPDGGFETYDKRHLFSYANEDKHYTPGTKPLIVEWREIRIMLQVCYDLRFPIFSRNTKDCPYDLCIYVASWPESRRSVWDTLLQARALENQCYVVGVNRVGDNSTSSSQAGCHYNGGTQLVDAYGKVIALAADNESAIITETLDMERLKHFRHKFPVLFDAD